VAILRPFLPQVELERVCRNVIDRLVPAQQEVHVADWRLFELRVRPYRTVDHVIGGAVLSLVPVDAGQLREQAVALAAIPTPALVLDGDMRVVAANDAAVDALGRGKVTLLGMPVDRLGSGELSEPRLRSALERALREGTVFRNLPFGQQRTATCARLVRTGSGEGDGVQILLLLDGAVNEGRS
jgi:two-component system CheB/CheR fusion protein